MAISAATGGTPVGTTGSGIPVYSTTHSGRDVYLGVVISSNGYIVTVVPVEHKRIKHLP